MLDILALKRWVEKAKKKDQKANAELEKHYQSGIKKTRSGQDRSSSYKFCGLISSIYLLVKSFTSLAECKTEISFLGKSPERRIRQL